jgi:hypothetical protein
MPQLYIALTLHCSCFLLLKANIFTFHSLFFAKPLRFEVFFVCFVFVYCV